MKIAILSRLVTATLNHDGQGLPDTARVTVSVGDLRSVIAAIERYRKAYDESAANGHFCTYIRGLCCICGRPDHDGTT